MSLGLQHASRRAPLDTTARVVTPERIELVFPVAGPGRRLVSYLIDQFTLFVVLSLLFIGAIVLSDGSGSVMGLGLVGYFALVWGYGIFCEGLLNGRTLGKRLMGLRVVTDQGAPINLMQAILRNVVGAVDGPLPFFCVLGFAAMVSNRCFQRLGDLAAGTMVVVEEDRTRRVRTRMRSKGLERLLERLPDRIEARGALERVLADYVGERERFSPSRRSEMAAPLASRLIQEFRLPEQSAPDEVLRAVHLRIERLA